MTHFLLDTHVILWLAQHPQSIPSGVKQQLVIAERIYISPASAYELSLKGRLGKLPQVEGLIARWGDLMTAMLSEELPISSKDMMLAGALNWDHRDPFDRILVAQAQSRGIALVTKDNRIHQFGGVQCMPWK